MREEKRAAWTAFADTFEHSRPGLGQHPGNGYSTDCVFCARVHGFIRDEEHGHWRPLQPHLDGRDEEVPASRRADVTPTVEEWDDHIAFRPLTPVTPLHTLVIPKAHVDDHTHGLALAATMFRAAEIARGFEHAGYDTNLIVSAGKAATQSVRHLHVHAIPRTPDDGLMVPWGTVYGDDPTAPHWCRTAGRERAIGHELAESLDESRAPSARVGVEATWDEAAGLVDSGHSNWTFDS